MSHSHISPVGDVFVPNVDLGLLRKQAQSLVDLLLENPDPENILWGLVEMLDYILDTTKEIV